MNDDALSWLTVLAVLGSGLVAGCFFAFSTFVTQALARLPAHEGIAAMQSINLLVVRSGFIAVFLGMVALCAVLGVAAVVRWHIPGSRLLLIGALVYIVGSFAVTIVFNVPLNDALASAPATAPTSVAIWNDYVVRWLRWNHVRTVASLVSSVAFVMALIRAAQGIR